MNPLICPAFSVRSGKPKVLLIKRPNNLREIGHCVERPIRRSDASAAPREVAPSKSLQYVGVERIYSARHTSKHRPGLFVYGTDAADRLGMGAVVLFCYLPRRRSLRSTVVPTRLALTGLTCVSHAHPAAAVVLALVLCRPCCDGPSHHQRGCTLCFYRTRNEPTNWRPCVMGSALGPHPV